MVKSCARSGVKIDENRYADAKKAVATDAAVKLASEAGVDLREVTPGSKGTVGVNDVRHYIKTMKEGTE